MRKVHNRAGQLFRQAACALHRNQTPLGDFLRRMKAKLGPLGATMATARKIATRGIVLLWQNVAGVGALMLLVVITASLLSIRRVLVLEPAAVFRG